ncbi:MAG: hypothetical protein ACI8WB_001376 [Phenylobacterium sp.]|jgi:hypothetical protein
MGLNDINTDTTGYANNLFLMLKISVVQKPDFASILASVCQGYYHD